LKKGDELVGMVVADPEATLLTACENGYGKRTKFGPGSDPGLVADEDEVNSDVGDEEDGPVSGACYRTQRRGGMGLRDIKTTSRNGHVIGIARVWDDDELIMMSGRGKIQRIAAGEISVIGRNTQGVRIMSLDEDDKLAAVKRVPVEEGPEEEA
jgi:DNA gyrase subunit A